MTLPDDDQRLVSAGDAYRIEFAVKSPTRMSDAWEWACTEDVRKLRAFMVLFKRVAQYGNPHDETAFKHLEGNVWEFKRPGVRVLCFLVGQRILLTNSLKKGGRKNITTDISAAQHIGEGHLKWEASREQNPKLPQE